MDLLVTLFIGTLTLSAWPMIGKWKCWPLFILYCIPLEEGEVEWTNFGAFRPTKGSLMLDLFTRF
jgi:hypothetical protein